MNQNGIGCRIMGLGCATLAIFAFFALLINFTEGTARSLKAKQQRDEVATDLSLLAIAVKEYAAGHNGRLPPMDSPEAFKKALYPSLVGDEVRFTRSGDNQPYIPNADLSGKLLSTFRNPGEVLLLREPEGGLPLKKEEVPPPTVVLLDGTVQR